MMTVAKTQLLESNTPRRWAIEVLYEAGAICKCEHHGWLQDRADPHARQRAFALACQAQELGIRYEHAIAAVHEVLESIGDTCPEC